MHEWSKVLLKIAMLDRTMYILLWLEERNDQVVTIYITISTITSVHPCVRCASGVRCSSQKFFLLKSPWNHPLTPGVDPRGWPRVPPGHAAPPEELARARRALSSNLYLAQVVWAVQLIFQFYVIPWSKTFAQDCINVKFVVTVVLKKVI